MADNVIELITAAIRGLTDGQREIATVLREIKEDITALNDRLDRLEKNLAANRQSPPESPESP